MRTAAWARKIIRRAIESDAPPNVRRKSDDPVDHIVAVLRERGEPALLKRLAEQDDEPQAAEPAPPAPVPLGPPTVTTGTPFTQTGTGTRGTGTTGGTTQVRLRVGIPEDWPTVDTGRRPGPIDPEHASHTVFEALQAGALARLCLEQGHGDAATLAEGLSGAIAQEVRLEEFLVERGLIDPLGALDLFSEVGEAALICAHCFSIQGEEDPQLRCPNCHSRARRSLSELRNSRSRTGADGELLESSDFPEPGKLFANHEIICHIADGGMGSVFKARDLTLNRVVALKVMKGGALASDERRERFLLEAESSAGFSHPHIIKIHQIAEEGDYPYYTMDLIEEGRDLDDFILAEEWSPRQTAALMSIVCGAVHHFHLRGVIHRDLKPDNVMVKPDGVPLVIDFGIATRTDSEDGEEQEAKAEEEGILGTPYYMPPEQAQGRLTEVDTRSDVYALGAILYQLLTGHPPYHELKHSADILAAIPERAPRSIRLQNATVDAELDAIVRKAMARERDDRYQSGAELAEDLRRYVEHYPVEALPASIPYRVKKFMRRNRAPVAALTGVLALAAAYGATVAFGHHERRAEVRARVEAARSAELGDRPELYAAALELDPKHPVAKAELDTAQRTLDSKEYANMLLGALDRDVQARTEFLSQYAHGVLIREALRASNEEFAQLPNLREEINARDEAWQALGADDDNPRLRALMETPLSRDMAAKLGYFRREYGYALFGEIFVTNRFGANMAQTSRTSDYRQDDEGWWQTTKRDGMAVSDVVYDASAGAYGIAISVRIEDADGGFLGVLKASLNISQVIAIVSERELGGGRELHLLDRVGRVLHSTTGAEVYSQGDHLFPAERLKGSEPWGTFPVAGKEMVGVYARSSGFREYKGLGWILAVDVPELSAEPPPLSGSEIALLIALALAGATVLTSSLLLARAFKD